MGESVTAPAVMQATLICHDGTNIVAWDITSGRKRWEVTADGLVWKLAIADNAVVVTGATTHAYELATGRMMWTRAGGDPAVAGAAGVSTVIMTEGNGCHHVGGVRNRAAGNCVGCRRGAPHRVGAGPHGDLQCSMSARISGKSCASSSSRTTSMWSSATK